MNSQTKGAERTESRGITSLTAKERGLTKQRVTDKERGVPSSYPETRRRVCPSMSRHPASINYVTTFQENFNTFRDQEIANIALCVRTSRASLLVHGSNLRGFHNWLLQQGYSSGSPLRINIQLTWSSGRVESIIFELGIQPTRFSRDQDVTVEGLNSPRYRERIIQQLRRFLQDYEQQCRNLESLSEQVACGYEIRKSRFAIWVLQNWDNLKQSAQARALFFRSQLTSETIDHYFGAMYRSYCQSWEELNSVCQSFSGFRPGSPDSPCQQQFQRWWTLNQQVPLFNREYSEFLRRYRSHFGNRIR